MPLVGNSSHLPLTLPNLRHGRQRRVGVRLTAPSLRGLCGIEELGVWRTAHELNKLHSHDPALIAAKRANEDDFGGCAVFDRIPRAIQDLERQKRPRARQRTNPSASALSLLPFFQIGSEPFSR